VSWKLQCVLTLLTLATFCVVPWFALWVWELKSDLSYYRGEMLRYRSLYDDKVFLVNQLRNILDRKRQGGAS
jgi:hypothetical protein